MPSPAAPSPRSPRAADGRVAERLDGTSLSQIDGLGGVKSRYVGEMVEADRADIRARLVGRWNREVTADARRERRGDRWLIYDVTLDGVSLIGNHRAQLDRVIRRSSYPDLVRQ
jgi:phospholipid transport system substrate-binding protein